MLGKKKKWFESKIKSGWSKDMPVKQRRELVLEAHDGDYLSSARAKQALANITTDKETKKKAQADAKYFYGLHRRSKE